MNLKIQKRWYWLTVVLLVILFGQTDVSVQPVQAWQSTTETYAAYQEFENGHMIWREDTGEIFAFVRSPNILYRFFETVNENLPDNPVSENSPSGFVKPIRGFGRVWGNYAYIRNQLGWGLHTEFGYMAVSTFRQGYPNWESISLPYGGAAKYFSDNSWYQVPDTLPPPLPPTPTPYPGTVTHVTGATYQEFEWGMMIYAGDSGTIWVLFDTGEAYIYRTYDYGRLPNNPVWNQPPPGYIRPIMGFGKVWVNFSSVRNGLGWAVTPEASYQIQIGYDANYSWVIMQLPSGEWIQIATSGSWYYR